MYDTNLNKVTGIESRVEKDGKRLIEMEKYKLDLVELRDSIYNKQTNSLDYNRYNDLGSDRSSMSV